MIVPKKYSNLMPLWFLQQIVGFIKYSFLTVAVISSTACLFLILLAINPHVSMDWFKYLSFLNPAYKTSSFSLGTGEVMEIYFLLIIILMIIKKLGAFILKKFFKVEIFLSTKQKMIIFLIFNTLLYIVTVIFLSTKDLGSGLYLIFGVFYVCSLVSGFVAILLSVGQKKLSQLEYTINSKKI